MPEPMTLEEAVAYLDRLHERAEPESFMETFGDMTNFCAAFDALLAHARATLAQRREGVTEATATLNKWQVAEILWEYGRGTQGIIGPIEEGITESINALITHRARGVRRGA